MWLLILEVEGGSSGGGGGGGGGSSGKSLGDSEIRSFSDKDADESLKIDVDSPNLDVEFLGLRFVDEQQNGYIQFKKIDSLEEIPLPMHEVYAYFIINHDVENENIKDGNILFRITGQWLAENNFNKEDVVLLRYESGWRELPTYYRSSDAVYNHYGSDINALSVFAIAAKNQKKQKHNKEVHLTYSFTCL